MAEADAHEGRVRRVVHARRRRLRGRLCTLLGDRTRAPDELLPSTGISREREQLLSAPFIVDDSYGTRCSTVLTVDRRGQARFVERTFERQGDPVGDVEHRFAIASAAIG